MRRSRDRLIFNMGIPIYWQDDNFYTEAAPQGTINDSLQWRHMSTMAPQITGNSTFCSMAFSGLPALLDLCEVTQPVTGSFLFLRVHFLVSAWRWMSKAFLCHDVIMILLKYTMNDQDLSAHRYLFSDIFVKATNLSNFPWIISDRLWVSLMSNMELVTMTAVISYSWSLFFIVAPSSTTAP